MTEHVAPEILENQPEPGQGQDQPWMHGVFPVVADANEPLFLIRPNEPVPAPGDIFNLVLNDVVELSGGRMGYGFKLMRIGRIQRPGEITRPGILVPSR